MADALYAGEERFIQSRMPRAHRYGYAPSTPTRPDYSHLLPGGGGGGGLATGSTGLLPQSPPSPAQFENANTAATNSDYAANAPQRLPEGVKALLPGTSPGSMSITLPAGQTPAYSNPGDQVSSTPHGNTITRQGTQRLMPGFQQMQVADARRNAYVNSQQRKADYLYPGMDQPQMARDANARANEQSAAGVANAADEQKQHVAAIKELQAQHAATVSDFKAQMAARDKQYTELQKSHADLQKRFDDFQKQQGKSADKDTTNKLKEDELARKRASDQARQKLGEETLDFKKRSNPIYREPSPPTTQGNGRLPNSDEIQAILKEANGDPDKAAEIATQRGFRVTR